MNPIHAESVLAAFPEWATPLPQRGTSGFTFAALVIALAAMVGSLWLSMRMGLVPCQLCLYQRSFVMAVAGILAFGLLTRSGRFSPLSMLALPVAIGGLGIALWQEYLEMTNQYECAQGFFGLGSVPQQSLFVQFMLAVTLVFDFCHCGPGGVYLRIGFLKALVVGILLSWVAITSIPNPRTFGPPRPESCKQGFTTISGIITSGV